MIMMKNFVCIAKGKQVKPEESKQLEIQQIKDILQRLLLSRSIHSRPVEHCNCIECQAWRIVKNP